jgi:protein involved in polysaccharide export with SLBB domain
MSSSSLELGEIVHVEVRDAAGTVTAYTHDYPIDASTLLRIPSLGLIRGAGMALTPELRDTIADRFVTDGILSPVTVNVSLSANTVDLQTNIAPGDLLFIRILGPDGAIDPSSGSFPVDGDGFINIPFLGGTFVLDNRFFEAEHQIEVGLEEGGFFTQPFVVNVTRIALP